MPWQEKPGREWLIEITADSNLDVAAFRKAIAFPGVETFAQKDRTFIRTNRVQHLLNPGEIKTTSEELLELLNGIVRVECPYYVGVKLKGLIRVFQDGTSQGIAMTDVSVLGLDQVKLIREYIERTPSQAQSIDILARTDKDVCEALRLFSLRDDPFMNLHKIFEILREDSGGVDAIVHRFGTSRKEIKRFTATANHPATGRQSRHARLKADPVHSPMSSSEARNFVHSILKSWILQKLENQI